MSSNDSSVILHNLFVKEGGHIAPGVAAQSHPSAGGGFGVIANSALRKGTVVASVPMNLWLNAATARRNENLTKQTVPSPVAAICIYLVRQRLRIMENIFARAKKISNEDEEDFVGNLLQFPVLECGGFSLAHVKLVQIEERIKQRGENNDDNNNNASSSEMSIEWIKRLPSQYDNFIQYAPHLEILKAKPNDGDKVFSESSKSFDDAIEELIAMNFDLPSKNNYQNSISLSLQQAFGLSKRYGDKSAVEMAKWRNMAAKHLKYLSFSESAILVPPTVSFAFDVLRKMEKSQNNKDDSDNKNNVFVSASSYFTNERLLIELFGWAYSSLMSRGFAHDNEVWLMQPWVDYFNYSPETTYNVNAMMNHQTRRFEFKARENIKEGTELCLHYGTYSDFELALWYGFTLCSCEEKIEEKSEDEAAASREKNESSHQSECEYVFSPLSNSDGDYSSDEFYDFVVQVVRLGCCLLQDHRSELAERENLNKFAKKIGENLANKMQLNFGSSSPRCAFSRVSGSANEILEFLCRKVCEMISEDNNAEEEGKSKKKSNSKTQQQQKPSKNVELLVSPKELLIKILENEVQTGFIRNNTKNSFPPLSAAASSDTTSPCAQFARRIGFDTFELLEQGIEKLKSKNSQSDNDDEDEVL